MFDPASELGRPDTIEQAVAERNLWCETALMFSRNEDYYRGLLDRIAEAVGPAAYTADDGSVYDSPVRAKLPELLEHILWRTDTYQPAPSPEKKPWVRPEVTRWPGYSMVSDTITLSHEAFMEALSALYGARAVMKDGGNISHAIKMLESESGLEYRGFSPPHRRGSEAEAMDAHIMREAMVAAAEAGLGAGHSSTIPRRNTQDAAGRGPGTEGLVGGGSPANAAEEPNTRNANDYQPGGSHYKRAGSNQHWDFVCAVGMHYLPACAAKYVGRWRFKNGRLDLEKALHYIHKAQEERIGAVPRLSPSQLFSYAAANDLNALEILATWAIMCGDWDGAADAVKKLMDSDNLAAQAERV